MKTTAAGSKAYPGTSPEISKFSLVKKVVLQNI